ncbi:MAG: hypothetical protein M3068_04450 [Gemmatimonadota bacterium]|nr:hypothetical protein [Gemmatimonadota bacterium]
MESSTPLATTAPIEAVSSALSEVAGAVLSLWQAANAIVSATTEAVYRP